MVWEPVLATDFFAPSTATLKRISDPRASQYWDKGRLVSHLFGETDRGSIVWDHVAIYDPGKLWERSLPEPAYSDGPVVDVVSDARASLQRLMEARMKDNSTSTAK